MSQIERLTPDFAESLRKMADALAERQAPVQEEAPARIAVKIAMSMDAIVDGVVVVAEDEGAQVPKEQ